jgi:cytochrome c biogenesis protein CcdA
VEGDSSCQEHRLATRPGKWGDGLIFTPADSGDNSGVLEVILIVMSLAVADAINPLTIAAAVYLASMEGPRAPAVAFAAGVFGVYFVGGTALALGPGRLLAGVAASSQSTVFHTGSMIAGVILIVVALVLARRQQTTRLNLTATQLSARAALGLGASVTMLDLPTAFPYFAAIGAIANSGASIPAELVLLLTFNLIYVLPLVIIAAARAFAGERAQRRLRDSHELVNRLAPRVVSGLTAITGVALIWRGADGVLA